MFLQMETIYDTVDVKDLLRTQENQRIANEKQEQDDRSEFLKNKKKLLKIILPLVHGAVALHNNKCDRSDVFGCDFKGLLGYGKVDLDAKLEEYVNKDHHFSPKGDTVEINLGVGKIKVWLHTFGKFVANSKLDYSLTSIGQYTYGNSVESELQLIAKYCAKYNDDWD